MKGMTMDQAMDQPADRITAEGTNLPGRRAFLVGGAALAAGTLRPAAPARIRRPTRLGQPGRTVYPARSASGPTSADWAALRRQLSTRSLSRPGERSYDRARELFDPRFDRLRPAGVAYCGEPADITACLSFASRFGLTVRPRSGGHSYAGWSSVTGGLVMDVTRMDHFSVGSGTVKVGAGTDLITLYDRLAAHGLAVPGGSCPTVGLAGLALGGGIGVLSRQFGLTSDNIESLQIVTADGTVRSCDSSTNSDLYWACRGGGGGNFGVATSFTLKTRRLRELVLFFLTWPWSEASRVVGGWQSWAPHTSNDLWSNMHLGAAFGGPPAISVGGTYLGSVAGAEHLLHELYGKVGSAPSSVSIGTQSYLSAMLIEAGCSGLDAHECDTAPGGHLPRVPFFAKSDFFTDKLSAHGIRTLLAGIERLGGIGGAGGGAGSIAFDALGGTVNQVAADATAFVHRDALFLAQYYTSWTFPGSSSGVDRQHEWLRGYYADLHPHASGQAYQNYIDPELTNWRQAYYGTNYARLSSVKATYDPTGVFHFPQGITP
jgi:FAD/FMN-containing dehydrogenase